MGFTTRVKSEASEKKPFNFALFWDKYGTFFILAIIVVDSICQCNTPFNYLFRCFELQCLSRSVV